MAKTRDEPVAVDPEEVIHILCGDNKTCCGENAERWTRESQSYLLRAILREGMTRICMRCLPSFLQEKKEEQP